MPSILGSQRAEEQFSIAVRTTSSRSRRHAFIVGRQLKMSAETLAGPRIDLRPLCIEHAAELVLAAADGELWNLSVTVVPSAKTVQDYMRIALEGRRDGTILPFVICIRETGQVVGTTRYWKIDRQNRKLEIGGTWLSESWQRSFVNTEAKYLMLRYAFDTLLCVRVQFTTDEANLKSRAAILRLGAKEEGVLRNERIMPDGRKRDSVRFSIIDDEWPTVRRLLEERLSQQSLELSADGTVSRSERG